MNLYAALIFSALVANVNCPAPGAITKTFPFCILMCTYEISLMSKHTK